MKDVVHQGGWSVYLLKCRGDRLYIGATNNLKNRLSIHGKGLGSKFVRAFSPFRFVASLEVGEKEKALALEYRLKRLSKFQKLEAFKK